MHNKRNQSAASLALVLVSGLIVAFIGIAVFFLIQIFGGGNEVHNAVDAGTLNVAKQAILTPAVPLPTKDAIRRAFVGSVDSHTKGINLLAYNRLVGQALLVALNAQAEADVASTVGASPPSAIANAQAAIDVVEGLDNSVGLDLSNTLSDANSNNKWATSLFLSAVKGNPVGLGEDTQSAKAMTWDSTSKNAYAVGYVGQDASENGSSNISISKTSIANQMPFTDYQMTKQVAWPAGATDGSGNFVRGYKELSIPHIGSLVAVALSNQQPHLVSLDRFLQQKVQPGSGKVVVPPNTFFAMASVTDLKTNTAITGRSAATVGTAAFPNDSPKPLSIPNGYLIIDNSGAATFSGPLPNPDNVAANELGTGINVDPKTGCFSVTDAAGVDPVSEWMAYNDQVWTEAGKSGPGDGTGGGTGGDSASGTPTGFELSPMGTESQRSAYQRASVSLRAKGVNPPPTANLYGSDGKAANDLLAMWIKPMSAPAPQVCTDLNSDSSNPDAVPTCCNHMSPDSGYIAGLDAFDSAYHPDANKTFASAGGTLTAAEMVKMEVMQKYSEFWAGRKPAVITISPPIQTGMRMYSISNSPVGGAGTPWGPPGAGFNQHSYPPAPNYSDAGVVGKVSRDGSMLEYMQQTISYLPYNATIGAKSTTVSTAPSAGQSPADELTRFITNRIYQIKPDATAGEVNAVLNTPLALGQKYYVFMDQTTRKIKTSTTPPFAAISMGAPGAVADGVGRSFTKTWDLMYTMANPAYEFNIHDHPFMKEIGHGSAVDTMSVTYTPASGAYNVLGVIKFQEQAYNQGVAPVLTEVD